MRKHLAIIAIIIATVSSCDICEIGPKHRDGSLSLAVDMEEARTKAAMSENQLLESASVNIYYADFTGLVRSYRYADAPEAILLPANEYRVDVAAGELAKASPAPVSWEQKSWSGSADFTIRSGENTSVTVVAKVCNAISKVSFDSTIGANFKSGYTLTIGTGDDARLVYAASNAGAEGYFIIDGLDEPEFEWTFKGNLSKDGSSFTKSGVIKGIEAGKVYDLKLKYTVTDGIGTFDLLVDYGTEDIEDIIIFEPLSTGLAASSKYEVWAAHADVHADVDESEYGDPSAIGFAFSSDGVNWTTVPATRSAEGVYDATLKGLSPDTRYTYRLMIGGEQVGEEMSFTTEPATAVPNGSFEESSKSESGAYTEFYNGSSVYPDCRNPWWGSGNGSKGIDGSADYGGFIICKPDTGTYVDGKQSACLQSDWAIVKFAAGNLFSGYFGGLVGTKGGIVYFGRPFTNRPTALKVWLKYSTGKVNRIDSYPKDDPVTTSDYDRARVQVALGTWDYRKYGGTKECPIKVNTTDTGTFVDYATDGATIAYGEVVLKGDSANTHNKWVEYVIPLDYRNTNEYPTHIVISCASSMLGDYFTGCDSSKLWVDKMELVYE